MPIRHVQSGTCVTGRGGTGVPEAGGVPREAWRVCGSFLKVRVAESGL